ncbi:MAG: hypothetical protein ABI151_14555 [Chitinophagaceae bacterium]
MDSYQNYVNLFSKFSPNEDGNFGIFKGLSDYSTYINNKANEIISEAADDNSIDCAMLQTEIFQMGVEYVKIFAMMNKSEKSNQY